MYLFPTERNREMWKYVLYARSAMKTKEKKFSKTLNVTRELCRTGSGARRDD